MVPYQESSSTTQTHNLYYFIKMANSNNTIISRNTKSLPHRSCLATVVKPYPCSPSNKRVRVGRILQSSKSKRQHWLASFAIWLILRVVLCLSRLKAPRPLLGRQTRQPPLFHLLRRPSLLRSASFFAGRAPADCMLLEFWLGVESLPGCVCEALETKE